MLKIFLIITLLLISLLYIISNIAKANFLNKIPKALLYSIIVFAIFITLIIFRVTNNKEAGGDYVPATFDGNTLTPGKVINEK